MFPKNAHHHRIPSKKEFFRSQEEMFNNRLTSVTPGRPDNRALGVQLPHSLSDPRTSPLRTSRRGGEYVQFDSEPGQLPFRRTINPSTPSGRTKPSSQTVYIFCIYTARSVKPTTYPQLVHQNRIQYTEPPVERQILITRERSELAIMRVTITPRPGGGESSKKDGREGVYYFFFLLFPFLLYRVARPVAGSKQWMTINTVKTRVSIIKRGRGFVIDEIITLKKKKEET